MANKPVLGYWNIRGIAQPARLMMAYAREEFDEHLYNMGPAPEYNKDEWLSVKFKLDLDFPNLPYIIDGSNKISQSSAIYRYIARKHNLCGRTEEERVRVDMLTEVMQTFRNEFVMMCYMPGYEENRKVYLEKLPCKLQEFENFLGDRKWFAGNELTYPDFYIYEHLDQHNIFAPGCLTKFPKLEEFMNRFEKLPTIEAYMKSSRFIKAPINAPSAYWGGETQNIKNK